MHLRWIFRFLVEFNLLLCIVSTIAFICTHLHYSTFFLPVVNTVNHLQRYHINKVILLIPAVVSAFNIVTVFVQVLHPLFGLNHQTPEWSFQNFNGV